MQFRMDEIPKTFWSEYTDAAFSSCINCNRDLLGSTTAESGCQYMVQKVIVRSESVFEFAMCAECAVSMHYEMSEESRTALSQYLSTAKLMASGPKVPPEDQPVEIECWIAACRMCGSPREECPRHTLIGHFLGNSIVIAQVPLLICETCELSVSELVSSETRDRWDQFVEDNFDGPPGLEIDTPDWRPVLV